MHRPAPPPPDPAALAELDALADEMLAEAVSDRDDRIFSASGYARENISILHQQIRCANLAWALKWKGRVGAGDVVGIVGGSFSGLMLASALALTSDAIVYIFEKEDGLLHRFRDKGHRHLSPVLNSRALGKRFDPTLSSPEFRRPIFAWEKGPASNVAAQWLKEFDVYDRKLPIFTFTKFEVRPEMVKTVADRLEIDPRNPDFPHLQPIRVDLLIDATGFGEEANPLKLVDFSYWEAGHRLIYDHLVPPAQVLISGCGDSGVIEGLHYALRDFRHEYVEALWRNDVGLEAHLDEGLKLAHLDGILKSSEVDTYDVMSEVCWWLRTWWNLEYNAHYDWLDAEPHTRPIFEKIATVLEPHLRKAFPGREIDALPWEEREAFVEKLPLDIQFAVRKAVQPVAEYWISRCVEDLAKVIDLPAEIATLHEMARPDISIIMNGTTPTPYTRQLSPYNVWLMRLLQSFRSVSYRPGKLTNVVRGKNRRFDSHFDDGAVETFDRVVSRYGPRGSGISNGTPRDTQRDDCLLSQPFYAGPDATTPSRGRYFHPAREAIACARDDLEERVAAPGSWDISKRLYTGRILIGPKTFPADDPLHADPQARLSAVLRNGQRPTYLIDPKFAQATQS